MATSLLSRFGRVAPSVRPCPTTSSPLTFNRSRCISMRRDFFRASFSLQTRRASSLPSSNSLSENPNKTSRDHPRSGAVRTLTLLASGGLTAAAVSWTLSEPDQHVHDNEATKTDAREPTSLPRFHLSEVRLHDGKSDRPWILHGDKVYDITDWIAGHPGGDVILRAAGGSVEPYWDIFSIHKTPHVYDILQQYLIGYVHLDDLVDGKIPQQAVEDPFSADPTRHTALRTLTAKPCNAEAPPSALASSFHTPNDLFYVRNHFWVPDVPRPDDHQLVIELPDGEAVAYSLAQLKRLFPAHSVDATLQCSGNRRKHMTAEAGPTNGLQWTTGGISHATWTGVRLSDVLAHAAAQHPESAATGAQHVHFSALEAYGASIPMSVATDARAEVLLAYEMNGAPLPRDHGFPLRALVPGHVAARSVKWLHKITLSDEESTSQWQRRDYKSFGPNERAPDWASAPSIQEMPVTSAITEAVLQDGPAADRKDVRVAGYAYSGGGRAITRVDVSTDGGRTWARARLLDDDRCNNTKENHVGSGKTWAWKRWEFTGPVALAPAASTEPSTVLKTDKNVDSPKEFMCSPDIVVKATDESYNTQPQEQASIYNARGNLATAWHRVRACEKCVPKAKQP
ncbi:hypothetical protein TD95_000153 [Thielaviopsis punctulata]|uniref:Nitrate reductase [NADPH] n=1 Tax=Thielaviopsis punctulata TaxID=72032 RepID=A0A0F4Z7V1_9PEZI|nr:hypothetical protein TD95_000153 [Thielaviopsis punctulata]